VIKILKDSTCKVRLMLAGTPISKNYTKNNLKNLNEIIF
jgi:hypothetical protein